MTSALDDYSQRRHEPAPEIDMKHVVLTRFAMTTGFAAGRAPEDMRGWIEHRAPIFADVCLPSLLGQSVKPDWWLLGFDRRYEAEVQDVLDLTRQHPWIVPVWQEQSSKGEPEGPHRAFNRFLSELVRGKDGHLITTRLDNDDALNLRYLERVESKTIEVVTAEGREDFWIAYSHGIAVSDSDIRTKQHKSPHFLSRCMTTRLFEEATATVFNLNHMKLHEDGRVVLLEGTEQPMWLEYCHDRNVINSIAKAGSPAGPRDLLLSYFGLQSSSGERPRAL